jgi:prepilin-type N-terminal cleavage/methylation domain-containing protein
MNSKSPNKSRETPSSIQRQSGFTLLEVLISIVILAFISIGIYEITSDTFRLSDLLANDSDFFSTIRLSMNMIDRDVTMLYTPKNILPASTLKLLDAEVTTMTTGQPQAQAADAKDQAAIAFGDQFKGTEYWGSIVDKTGIRLSRFIGTETSIKFITAAHVRIYKDARESIFAKVSYGVERVKSDGDDPVYKDTQTLIKTSNPNVYDYEKDDGPALHRYPLLQGVKSFKFQYYSKDKDKWFNTWDSESPDTKFIYPDRIKIDIEVIGPQELSFQGTYVFKPEIPFNGIAPTT